jgi:hypothetical protein
VRQPSPAPLQRHKHRGPFTAASVGRSGVRLRKNTLGIHRLDHDAGLHDDQAITLSLGGRSPPRRRRGRRGVAPVGMAESYRCRGGHHRREGRGGSHSGSPRGDRRLAVRAEPAQEPELTGVVLDPAAARKRARDERFQASEL